MTASGPTVEILQLLVDEEDDSLFRVLVDNKHVKYLTIEPGIYETIDMCWKQALPPLLPAFPEGDWNTGRISRHPLTGEPHFADVLKEDLPGVTRAWHTTQVDHLEVSMGKRLKPNTYEATSARFPFPVVAKFACFTHEVGYFEAETKAYEWVREHDIGPEFLGHLLEEGRIIGFIMSKIDNCRHATPDDLPACERALSRLHKLGIKHGDTNKHNFLIRDNEAVLVDFECAEKGASAEQLDEEMAGLMGQLQDTSGRGGGVMCDGANLSQPKAEPAK